MSVFGAAAGPADRVGPARPGWLAGARVESADLVAGLLVLLAAALRATRLDLMEFRLDSAYWALEALDVVAGDRWPLVGQQVGSVTVRLYNGPALTYFVALAFWALGPSPVYPALAIGLLAAAGAGVTYWLG